MDAWIRFMAPVAPQTAKSLMQAIDQRLASGATQLHLLLSSPGGSVFHGLSLHNFLKGLSVPVVTYNFGSVDSIGVVVFCAGSKRYCVPSARFHIHGVKFGFEGKVQFDEKGLEEHLKLLKTDYTNIARVIATTTNRTEKQVVADMNKQTSLMPEQAVKYGLVHEIRSQLIPAQAGMTVIYEDASSFTYERPPQQADLATAQAVTAVKQGISTPIAEAYTSTPSGFTGQIDLYSSYK